MKFENAYCFNNNILKLILHSSHNYNDILLDDFVASVGACLVHQVDERILCNLPPKYVTLIGELKKVFEKEEKRYPVPNIIISLSAADEDNLTVFSTIECLRSAKTIDEVFLYITIECNCFDFTILKTFIEGSGCTEAKELMENYIKEIENTVIVGLNLQKEYHNVQTERCDGSTKKFEIVCDKNELKAKELNLIVETLRRCFDLPRASVMVTDVKKNCIVLICRVPLKVEYYLLQLRITVHKLIPLSTLKITSLVLDGKMKLNIPMDCDSEVRTYVRMYVCDIRIMTYTLGILCI